MDKKVPDFSRGSQRRDGLLHGTISLSIIGKQSLSCGGFLKGGKCDAIDGEGVGEGQNRSVLEDGPQVEELPLGGPHSLNAADVRFHITA